MAVQTPDAGLGDGKTGDNEYVFRKKVQDNFSNTTHAANRQVGTQTGNVMQVGAFGLGSALRSAHANPVANMTTSELKKTQMLSFVNTGGVGYGQGWGWSSGKQYYSIVGNFIGISAPYLVTSSDINTTENTPERTATYKQGTFLVTNYNCAIDANGFIKSASPIVKVFADKIELNDEAQEQSVTFIKNGVGDYIVTTSSGLSSDGWYLELPKDLNGNPKIAVTLSETDGVINLKSYKRIFSMTTFTFEPDLEQPLDIPDGRWIDLRLNEIPTNEPDMPGEV